MCFTLSALPWSVCTEQAGGQTPAQRVLFYSWRVIPALHLLNLLPWSVCPEFSPTPPPLTLALSSSHFHSNSDFSTMQNQISWFLISIAPYFLLVYIFLVTRRWNFIKPESEKDFSKIYRDRQFECKCCHISVSST